MKKYILILLITAFGFAQNSLSWYNYGKLSKLPLKFTVNTNLGTGASMTIPAKAGNKSYVVNWGDGTGSNETGNATHTYASHGTYQITIRGTFLGFNFNNSGDKLKLVSIDEWGDVGYTSQQNSSLYGCENLTSITDESNQMNKITNGFYLFTSCLSLNTLPSGLTFENVQNGHAMFLQCSSLSNLPSGVAFNSLNYAPSMFYLTTINTTRYSQLLNDLDIYNLNSNVIFDGGSSKYNSSAVSARSSLLSKGWTITDGGL